MGSGMSDIEKTTTPPGMLYGIDDVPPPFEALTLGFQHYLTMFGSTVAIPLLLAGKLGIEDKVEVGMLISTMFFVSGLTTILQTQWGNRLPIVQGGMGIGLACLLGVLGAGLAMIRSVGR